ncbi:MAG: recombinase family protein [Treponema sp.]|nr:recombinase family protein [Treponema sp.]
MGICGIYARTSAETDGTSIEQQKELGIKFCNAQGFQYQVYEDIGKSGYKIHDRKNPFKHLQGLTKLLDDIEQKRIDRLWVWEHSRMSRNDFWFLLKFTLIENKAILYDSGKEIDLNDPESELFQDMKNLWSKYERNKIVRRTTRGIKSTINTGRRSYHKKYGYKQIGKDDRFIIWEPVQSEIENIKYIFEYFLKGRPINNIVKELHNDETDARLSVLFKNYRNILSSFDYTGFSLTTEGAELCNKFKKSEINNFDFLYEQENGKPKYYLPSINYPVNIISIEDYINSVKMLVENKQVYKKNKRNASSDIFSGITNCPYCNKHYYTVNDKDDYKYYTHNPTRTCLQKPKSIRREIINNLVEAFYFYYYLVFDDTKELLKENQKLNNLNLTKIKDNINSVESNNRKIEKQINNFQNIYEENSSDKDLLKLTLIKENELKQKLEVNNSVITKLNIELNKLKEELTRDEMELTYYNTKELILSFFEKLSIENKRTALLKIIKKCQLFGYYLLIDTGYLLFIFNIKENYKLPELFIEELKNDEHFMKNFLNSNTLLNEDGEYQSNIKKFINTPISKTKDYTQKELNDIEIEILDIENKLILREITRRIGERRIKEYFLKTKDKIIMEKRLQKLGIDYLLKDINKVISFIDDI